MAIVGVLRDGLEASFREDEPREPNYSATDLYTTLGIVLANLEAAKSEVQVLDKFRKIRGETKPRDPMLKTV